MPNAPAGCRFRSRRPGLHAAQSDHALDIVAVARTEALHGGADRGQPVVRRGTEHPRDVGQILDASRGGYLRYPLAPTHLPR